MTDREKLSEAFRNLERRDGFEVADERADCQSCTLALFEAEDKPFAYVHSQDVERGFSEAGTLIGKTYVAFGGSDDGEVLDITAGNLVEHALREQGFVTQWNGDPSIRIAIIGVTETRMVQPSDARTEPAPIDPDTVRTLVNGHESYCIYYDGAENECSCGYDAAAIRADQWLDLHSTK